MTIADPNQSAESDRSAQPGPPRQPGKSASPGSAPLAATFFLLFLAVAIAHLVFRGIDSQPAEIITKALTMPILAATLWATGVRSHMVSWVMIGLFFSWIGDSLPWFFSGDTAFLTMVGGFLVAQFAYITAFWRLRTSSILVVRKAWLFPYAVLFVALVVACLPGAGVLAPAVVIYGIALVTTAILVTGMNVIAWIGGALFFISDGLIALKAFADFWPLSGAVQSVSVMATYLPAQLLLVIGVLAYHHSARLKSIH